MPAESGETWAVLELWNASKKGSRHIHLHLLPEPLRSGNLKCSPLAW